MCLSFDRRWKWKWSHSVVSDSMDCSLPGSFLPWDFPGKNTGVGCCFLLQGIFLTQRSNLGLLTFRQTLQSEPAGKPCPFDRKHSLVLAGVFYWIYQGIACNRCSLIDLISKQQIGCSSVAKSCLTLATLSTIACQFPLSMEFSRQEYWSGLPFPSPGDLPNLGIEPNNSLLTELWGKCRKGSNR